jgi:P pilus assembly chaperone PapD
MPLFSRVRILVSLLGATFALLGAGQASAMSVTPIQIEMTSTGGAGKAQVTVNNDSTEPLPVEVEIQKLALDEKGDRKLSKAGSDFLLFPPQALVAPGASQVFRLQWVGEPAIARSESYLMSVNQVPVKLPAGKSAVQIVMSFGVVINVAPPQGSPSLAVISTGVEADKKSGKRYPTITVENPTNIHALLPQSTIALSGDGWSQTLTPTDLTEKIGVGLVQPGMKRRFVLPIELPPEVKTLQANLDFKPKR